MSKVACDLPSGVDTNNGAELSPIPDFDLTVTFGALKPAHRLMPAMRKCGRVVLADIGIPVSTPWREIGPPELPSPDPQANKYSRGLVLIVSGQMPGAAILASTAAAKSGAGTVRLYAEKMLANVPAAVVQGVSGQVTSGKPGHCRRAPVSVVRTELRHAKEALPGGRQ